MKYKIQVCKYKKPTKNSGLHQWSDSHINCYLSGLCDSLEFLIMALEYVITKDPHRAVGYWYRLVRETSDGKILRVISIRRAI